MTLYEVTNDYINLFHKIETGEIPEEAINDTLDAVEGTFEMKADNLACYIKNLDAEAKAIQTEVKNLQERLKQKLKESDHLIDYLQKCMLVSGKTKIETARNKLTFRSSERVTVTDEQDLLKWLVENRKDELYKIDYSVNKTELKKAMQTEEIPFVTIEKRQNLQIK